MQGLIHPDLVRDYIEEQTGISRHTWLEHTKRIPRPTTPGPGGKLYYTEADVELILDYWRQWWRCGYGSSKRDSTSVLGG